jgi:hypothetical protein
MRRNAILLTGFFFGLPLVHGPAAGGDAKTGFAFADDKAGRLLERLLRPGDVATPASSPGATQLQARTSSRIDNPEIPLAAVQAELPKSKPNASPQPRPRGVPEPLPLTEQRQDPVRPELVALPAGTRIRLESVDVSKPIPLPILGQAQPDRAPLTDPTFEASLSAALAGQMPTRTAPAPFVRLNLPDPFEHTHAVRLRTPLPELPAPPTAQPRTPSR